MDKVKKTKGRLEFPFILLYSISFFPAVSFTPSHHAFLGLLSQWYFHQYCFGKSLVIAHRADEVFLSATYLYLVAI